MSEPIRAWLDQMNQPCSEPGHERVPDPNRPGKTRCRTCRLALGRRASQRTRRKDRDGVLAAYGRTCACCNEHREVFLTVDHIDEDGAAHRRELMGGNGRMGAASQKTHRWLRENGYPPGFQILCFNCNYAKHRLGECPHQTERRPDAAAQPGPVV